MPDQKIVQLIRAGRSDAALDALYGYFPMARKTVVAHGGSTQDAEDVFQEGLLILCRKIRETDFVLTARLSTYLFSVCRLLWMDELKKRKRAVPPTLQDPPDEALADVLLRESRFRLAEKVLAELADRCRELLLLFYTRRLKWQEVAARMGYSSENVARNQKYKCLEAARTRLAELEHQTL
ncbi:RNA polymerase sigma factor [Dinghuibacter silviterrae]|uniref:RNA polymerase sigma factor (Sigma-70 family) n=1 Tax=Dinghuibacter silviterrae TaxID=1539049 RepID=A0A4R8DP90_9BACT|nr:sigma-70 family RNA polymerase sigma factor [Dinghuibacter silviterrae]TDW99517.1 RNA polymerase sigma factor (sigma-70 family) [Dinghuibacter silviterrae]